MRVFCPEVVQTSAMDCGPAALKALLEGFGVSASYGRLREACQTDVDGTSIDTLEEVAVRLGLDATQVMLPVDHLLAKRTKALPALVVVQLPNGFTHFVVVWRRHGGFLQVMDPATGRRWMSVRAFQRELYVHEMPISAAGWREWAGSDDFLSALRARLRALDVDAEPLLRTATADAEWRGLATLDAATRLVAELVRSGTLHRGGESRTVLARTLERALRDDNTIPPVYWSARAAPPAEDGSAQVILRGAVLLQVSGVKPAAERDDSRLSPELAAALREPPTRPGRALLAMLRADGLLGPAAVAGALGLAALGAVVEAVLFRGLFDVGQHLGLFHQRLAAMGALLTFLVALVLLELPALAAVAGIGRRLEARLRVAFLSKIPRLGDRYFASRPTSDMADRSHVVHTLRWVPDLLRQLLSTSMELVVTTLGLAWLDPRNALVAVGAALVGVTLPLVLQPPLQEVDLRVRVHNGALSRFYLDALIGLVAVRTHGAERAVRREHESLLVEWVRASRAFLRTTLVIEGLQAIIGFALSAWLLVSYLGRGADAGGALLLVYWALNLPVLGESIALAARQVPIARNLTLRLYEPLGAPDEGDALAAPTGTAAPSGSGVAIALSGVGVIAGGHTILDGVDLDIPAGTHVAVVGASGAGKSSLVGLLLGWHRAHAGTITVDGEPLDASRLATLRRSTAWIDPAVQLWNRTFVDNLHYGSDAHGAPLEPVIDAAELRRVLEQLPEGLQTPLGEGGGLLSGGEGQRVRFGRSLLRRDARLVILDEPFRGLDREKRRTLYARARAWWPQATLICVTHDVSETFEFPRVLVIEGGHIVEDGPPVALAAGDTRYRAMLDAEEAVRRGLWSSEDWRHVRIVDGRVREET
jgi:ATP-binding cassette subfamily B protein